MTAGHPEHVARATSCEVRVAGRDPVHAPTDDEAETIAFRDAAQFEAWLDQHHDRQAGVWLKLAKRGSGIPSLTSDEAVDIGLCFGWISGRRRSLDEVHYLQKYVPRRPRSR